MHRLHLINAIVTARGMALIKISDWTEMVREDSLSYGNHVRC